MIYDNMSVSEMENIAVDMRYLATNFPEVIPDCCGLGAEEKTRFMEENELYFWLLNTPLAQFIRARINENRDEMSACVLHKDTTTGGYVIDLPGTYWTLPPQDTSGECCWVPFDFAKCSTSVPVNRLCLKDCDNLDDIILGRYRRLNRSYGRFGRRGEDYVSVKERIAKLSMAWLTPNNVILGTDGNFTPTLKPFHGLLQVMMNPAVAAVDGTSILAAFDSAWCRLKLLGYRNTIFTANQIIIDSIAEKVQPGQNGRLPEGWSKDGGVLRFHGIRFVADYRIPVDFTTSTGDVYLLSGDAVGAWMAANLLDPIKRPSYNGGQFTEQSYADGCGAECKWWYNYGAVFNNNANKLMKIVNVPISAACLASTGDLGSLIVPETMVPKI